MSHPIVEIYDYNPDWATRYKVEKIAIMNEIEQWVLKVEHIGSTSIKGLSAKPIIDILVGIDTLEQIDALFHPLRNAGYTYVPMPQFPNREFFRKGPKGKGTVHLHICELNGEEWFEKILFRDYLRKNPEAAREYERLKRTLAVKYRNDRQTYTEKKVPFIKNIIREAMKQK
ncbi:GrpB family protein [Bacillus solimangrovi]|uniref:GrpB family protein n=1 Tax=Bacillus solimangrovi TaxID=1305675 RepID=A0A1E5LJB9_9BACI|nr:GrpB family protein [Bacillus solimangrovi]OEH94187.1 hypothetical protein BFG57_09045 [Bacillus solimangrovi]